MIRFFWSHVGLAVLFCTVSTGTIIHVPTEQPTIQAGIDAAGHGDTVLVDTGRYVENINFNGKKLILGSWFLVTGDTSYISQTVIDGNARGPVVVFHNGEDYTVVLSGLTITNGNAPLGAGGGIYFGYSSPTIINAIIKGNSAHVGGGIAFFDSNPILTNVVIEGNFAEEGGGIYCSYSRPSFTNVAIIDNHAAWGGGISITGSSPVLTNVTIGRNTAATGAGVFCNSYSNIILINTIIWNEFPDEIYFTPSYYPGDSSSMVVYYSDVRRGDSAITTNDNATVYWLDGNIDADPLFVDAENGVFNLQKGSPCINAGTAFFIWEGDTIVNMPDTAYQGGAPDMGAFESPYSVSIVRDWILPIEFNLRQPYPNPFNPATTIQYDLPRAGYLSLAIYDLLGREVEVAVNSWQEAGRYSVVLDATGMPSGIYLVRMVSGDPSRSSGQVFSQVRKVMVLK